MRRIALCSLITLLLSLICFADEKTDAGDGWISLFNGKTLDGWKASEHEGSFQVRDGMIVANGKPFSPDFHFSFGSANHRVDSDAFIYAGLKALKALRRSTPNG